MTAGPARRFYKQVAVTGAAAPFAIALDDRTLRTPLKRPLDLPTRPLAEAIAAEWDAQEQKIEPHKMPLTKLANTALDRVATDKDRIIGEIVDFAGSDLVCYRAASPPDLVERQARIWQPVLDWARSSLGARFNLAEGVIHVEQPREAIAVLGAHLGQRAEPMRLAAIHVMTSLTGSALLALAVDFGEIDAEEAWGAAHVDEDWQIEHWGQDAEAMARRSARKRDLMAAVSLLEALQG